MRSVARRSVVAVRKLPRGHVLADWDVALKRPGDGVSPEHVDVLIGRALARDVAADDQIRLEDLC